MPPESLKKVTLDDYVDAVSSIYGTHDAKRSVWDVWCHTLHHAAGIAEQIRRNNSREKLHEEIADFSLWLFTIVLKLKGRFGEQRGCDTQQEALIRIQSRCSDLIWHKYPNLCPKCFSITNAQENGLTPCKCPEPRGENESDETYRARIKSVREYSESILYAKPSSVDEWQVMFGRIFGRDLKRLTLTEIALHVMEELGEASNAMIRMYTYKERTFRTGEPNWRQRNLEAELADVFCQLFLLIEGLTATTEIQGGQSARPTLLSGIIWSRYGSDDLNSFFCRHCKNPVCRCPIILVPATHPIRELIEKFEHLDKGGEQ